jgi:hypothetical protein
MVWRSVSYKCSHMQSEGPNLSFIRSANSAPILTRPPALRMGPLSVNSVSLCSPPLGSYWRVHVVKLKFNPPNGVYVLT